MRPIGGLVLAACIAAAPAAAGSGGESRLLLGSRYPIEAEASFAAGLFHWVDSLAGTSAGKTIEAHRKDFRSRFGPLDAEDRRALEEFTAARLEHVRRFREAHGPSWNAVPAVSALLGEFCAASSLEDALGRASGEMSPEALEGLRRALEHFRPKYVKVWDGGRIPRGFLDRARGDGAARRLAALLAEAAKFFGVPPDADPPPRLVVVPVPGGWGTHAEAVGRCLLMEVRDGEGLADEASVIAHENTHFLFYRVPPERRDRLAAALRAHGPDGERAWTVLHEALPTAVGQGVADHEFRPTVWSYDAPWYHLEDVDAYAKAIYPWVNHALTKGGRFDETFLEGALARLPAVTPRPP